MKATRKVRSSKRSKSKSRRRSNKVRRQRKPPQLASGTRAEEQHNEGASPSGSEPELSLPNRECASRLADDGGAIAASPAEQAFFAVTVDRSATEPVHDDPEPHDPEPLLLRPEQLERRLWFRRQVARLMAGAGAFSVITIAIRIASSG
jgi:hypothetical protein